MSYAIAYRADHAERHSRLTTFFRFLLLIPVFVVVYFWLVVGFFTVIVAWFAIVITGRYPSGLYDFHCGVLRAYARCSGYAFLQTDRFPPLGIAENPDYPIRVEIAPRQERYSRVQTLFRAILAIPAWVVAQVYGYVIPVIAFAAWFVVVFTGRMPDGLHKAQVFLLGYVVRANGYMIALLSDTYPPFGDDSPPAYHDPYGLPPGYPPAVGQPYGAGQPPTYGQPPGDGGVSWTKPSS